MGINIYLKFSRQFYRMQFFDKEGYSFCPTVVLNAKEDLPKGYNLYQYKFSNKIKLFGIFLFGIILFKIYTAEDIVYKDLSELKTNREYLNLRFRNNI